MFIEELTIDGFKSYAQRVTVTDFDQKFNAITGLNGSGKSNILDAICFVLGISDTKRVRAQSLQELIYKQGQAGVTKASVSVVFNNEDKSKSPTGYEQHDKLTVTRQLALGGREKHLINGKVATKARVKDLFLSVSLNVDEPHFLIMQGTITQVCNQAPSATLVMLENAAGTKMYEDKKRAALMTMEKKQLKVVEIDTLLQEEVLPALDKLKREKVEYMRWTHAHSRQEAYQRLVLAHEYCYQESLTQDSSLDAARGEAAAAVSELESMTGQLLDCQDSIKGLEAEKELQAGGEVKELQAASDDLSKRLVAQTSEWEGRKQALAQERSSLTAAEASLTELDEAAMNARVAAAEADRTAAVAALEAAAHGVEAAQRELDGAQAGDGRDESNRSMQERLEDARNAQTTSEAEAKQADLRAKHCTKQLADSKKALAGKQSEAQRLAKELHKAGEAVEACASRLSSLEYDEAAASSLEERASAEQSSAQALRERVDDLSGQLSGLSFQYRDPERGFDRSKVKGAVAKLVRVKDLSTATALEVVAGGKMYQVVVDTEATAKALLSHGQLRQRVTIIPLNKVSAHVAPQRARDAAQQLSGGKAGLALELVGFDRDLGAAMNYVFGGAFVCKDAGTAKKLAFSREVGCRCVTLEGDDFNPSGLLTGGSRARGASLLTRLAELRDTEEKLAVHEAALAEARQQLQGMAAAKREHAKLTQELDLKRHALQLLQQRIAGSESAQLQESVAQLQTELEAAVADAQAAREKKTQMAAAAKELEREIANFGKERDARLKAAASKVKAAKQALEAAKKEAKAKEAALQAALAERESMAGERKALGEQLEEQRKAVEDLSLEADALQQQVAATDAEYKAAKSALAERRARLKECDKEIQALNKELNKLAKKKEALEAERKRRDSRVKQLEGGIKDAKEALNKIEEQYPWILQEKRNFGRAGGDFDFAAHPRDEAIKAYSEAKETAASLANKVNKHVLQLYEKTEQEYRDLTAKKDTVQNDKRKIERVITELDEKKREALRLTWEAVNSKFGLIFSTLLPGTDAKLEPPQGQTFLDGLEMRVSFGGVWKQSLSELSGGQRSLLALSLVLAMLLYKPAPLYILDEVDAALDLNHTQNIGRMIVKHFPQSQFVIVSLKEGMFSNANVIFRTRFVDGVSNVQRTLGERRAVAAAQGNGKQARNARPALKENVRS